MAVTGTNASIDQGAAGIQGLQKSLDAISSKITFNITKLSIDTVALNGIKTQIENTLSGINVNAGNKIGGIAPPNTSGILPSIPGYGTVQTETFKTPNASGALEATKIIYTYKNELNEIVKETWIWEQAQKDTNGQLQKSAGWVQTIEKTNDELLKKEREKTAEYKRLNAQADKFLAKIKLMKSTGDVTSGRNIANQMKEALTSGNVEKARQLSGELAIVDSKVRATGKSSLSWAQAMGNAIEKTLQWAGAMTLLYGSIREIEKAITYIRDLNKEMTNIRLVTGLSKSDVANLAKEYNSLAKELGATTLEVSRGSLEWFNI
jgi:hypothetical protein